MNVLARDMNDLWVAKSGSKTRCTGLIIFVLTMSLELHLLQNFANNNKISAELSGDLDEYFIIFIKIFNIFLNSFFLYIYVRIPVHFNFSKLVWPEISQNVLTDRSLV